METLVLADHRNHYCSRVKSCGPARFASSPSKNFRQINCRTFDSGLGILPTPKKSFASPCVKQTEQLSSFSFYSASSKTPWPSSDRSAVDRSPGKNDTKSSPIPITGRSTKSKKHSNFELFNESRSISSYPELWAGPTYSNSPPPSSVPIPKFSLRTKRTVSLELPPPESDIDIHQTAKSAPASPTREFSPSYGDLSLRADFATKTLRRMLNLDGADE